MSKKKKTNSDPVPAVADDAAAPPPVDEVVAPPSLDDPDLVQAISEAEPPAAEVGVNGPAGVNGPQGESPPGIELPATIQPRVLRQSLDVLAESMPSIAAFSPAQRELLAEVWARPIDDLYQRLWRLLGADPEKLGPWGAAVTVTAALVLPRILPKIVKAARDRFAPTDSAAAP